MLSFVKSEQDWVKEKSIRSKSGFQKDFHPRARNLIQGHRTFNFM